MATQKLTNEQRATLLEWLAADYDYKLIMLWFKERGWPQLSYNAISYYRRTRDAGIQKIRMARRSKALLSGLATKEERVKQLVDHADELRAIMWEPDKNGRLWNEKAWRETLADIAAEMGHRKLPVEFSWEKKLIDPIKAGKLSFEEVSGELGEELAKQLFNTAGVSVSAGGEVTTTGSLAPTDAGDGGGDTPAQ